MIACVKCAAEMRCDKNGVGILFGEAHVYPGDRFKCPKCGTMIIVGNKCSIFDPGCKTQQEYLKMSETN